MISIPFLQSWPFGDWSDIAIAARPVGNGIILFRNENPKLTSQIAGITIAKAMGGGKFVHQEEGFMKITNIETFIVDAGWRPWTFVKVQTDAGIAGYGECSDGRSPHGVVGTIKDLERVLIGTDARAYEMRFWDMIRGTR